MRQKYRIYVIGDIPHDLRERIADIHASAILRSKREDIPTTVQGPKSKNILKKGDDK